MEKICPGCDRHCPSDAPGCRRGREYFNRQQESQEDHPEVHASAEEKFMNLLRECGHFLHHKAGHADPVELAAVLNADEKAVLETLLKKCLDGWRGAGVHAPRE